MSAGRPIKLLLLLTKRQPPSSRLRFSACFDDFRSQGIEPEAYPIPSGLVGRLRMFAKARAADVVVLQKKTSLHAWELKLLRRANPRIVFDMDDAVMFHELEHRRPLSGKNFRKFIRTVDHCAAVVAGNAFLAGFAAPNCRRVFVLPTPVDDRLYVAKDHDAPSDGTVTIGWLGVAGNLRYLAELQPVFAELAARFPQMRLKIVSNDFIDLPGVPVLKEKWALASEGESLRSFDIGIMPLDDSLWARGKCGYKILQYMGAALPVVASPVGINGEFVQPGVTGYLAADHAGWIDALSRLIADAEARKRFGLAGRTRLEAEYGQARYAGRYAGIVRELRDAPI